MFMIFSLPSFRFLRKFAKIFAYHGAPMGDVNDTGGEMATCDTSGKFTDGVVDAGSDIFSEIHIDRGHTSSKCATGVNDPGRKFAAGATDTVGQQ